MAADLLATDTAFAAEAEAVDRQLTPQPSWSVFHRLRQPVTQEELAYTVPVALQHVHAWPSGCPGGQLRSSA